MYTNAGLLLELAGELTPLAVFEALIAHGWSATTGGELAYLPLGDGEQFAWRALPAAEWPRVRAELLAKQAAGEALGLALCWQTSVIGGTFHVECSAAGKLMLWTAWYPQRMRLLDSGGLTNQSWYLRRVVPPLLAAGLRVLAVTCNEAHDQ